MRGPPLLGAGRGRCPLAPWATLRGARAPNPPEPQPLPAAARALFRQNPQVPGSYVSVPVLLSALSRYHVTPKHERLSVAERTPLRFGPAAARCPPRRS